MYLQKKKKGILSPHQYKLIYKNVYLQNKVMHKIVFL